MYHPREMGVADVEAFLYMQANDKMTDLLAHMAGVNALQAGGTDSLLYSRRQV